MSCYRNYSPTSNSLQPTQKRINTYTNRSNRSHEQVYDSAPTPPICFPDTFLNASILPLRSNLAASGLASSYGNDVSRCSSISYERKNFCCMSADKSCGCTLV